MVEQISTERTEADELVVWYQGYDRTMYRTFLRHVKRKGKAVPVVFATPERAFGQMAKTLAKRWGRQVDVKSIPLPFISMQRLDANFDVPERWRHARMRKAQALGINGERVAPRYTWPENHCDIFAWEGFEWPTPTQLPYQIDVWARNLFDLDLISQQVIRAFNMGDEVWLGVKHEDPFGWRIVPVTLTQMSNNSQLEAQDGEERQLRRTIGIRMDGWVPRLSTTVKAVRRIDIQIADIIDPAEVLEEWIAIDVDAPLGQCGKVAGIRWDAGFNWDYGYIWDGETL